MEENRRDSMRQNQDQNKDRYLEWDTEHNMDRYQVSSGPEGPKKRKSGFGSGVLVGVVSTFAAFAIVFAVTLGIFSAAGKRISIVPSSQNGTQAEESEDSGNLADKSQSNGTGGFLSVDLLSEAALIHSYMQQYYLYDMDEDALRDGMLQGMVAALGDPYSSYFNKEDLASFTDSTEGEYYGIGAVLTQERSTGIIRVSRPYEGTPSAEAGLLPGDIVVSVGGTEVTGMELSQAVTLIKGEEGTSVVLHIYRESEEKYLDVEVTRRKVEVPTVTHEMLENQVGYIMVTSFDGVTTDQFIQAFEDLKAQGMKGVIVDLRDNGGGYVDTVEAMLDYLLPEGVLFYAKDKAGTKSLEYSSDENAALNVPMAVLVNGNSASASEIFAGNIKEFGAGKLVGTTTFGKGVMQKMFYTNEQQTAAVKITVGDYYIHSDKNINGVGFTPDVEVELSEEAAKKVVITKEEDNQLQQAIDVVNQEINGQ